MSDDISIPRSSTPENGPARTSFTHSYRSRRSGMDRGTKRLLLAASVLAAALIGGMAIWTFTGHKTAGVPTIAAETQPLRIKPADPGGMAAIGVGEQGMGAAGATSDLAPAAEQPDPQALLAQQRQAAAPQNAEAAAPQVAQPAAPQVAQTAAPQTAQPAAAQQTASTTPAAVPAATSVPPAAARPAGPMVQLAALDSEAGANAEWQRLSHKLPALLGARKPVVERTEQNGRTFWRLRTGGFADMADATEFCKQMRAKRLGCSLANF